MAPGMCAGLVVSPTQADSTRNIRMPRGLLELNARTWLVTDLGAWTGSTGAVWRIRIDADNATRVDALVTGLRLPHSFAWGPDGRVYVSEMGRIFRMDPDSTNPADTIEKVISDLPGNRLHTSRHRQFHLRWRVHDCRGQTQNRVPFGAKAQSAFAQPDGLRASAWTRGDASVRAFASLGVKTTALAERERSDGTARGRPKLPSVDLHYRIRAASQNSRS